MIKFANLLFAAGVLSLGLLGEPVLADTPKDTLVMAKQIDDIITLDPAEVFELSGGEVIANIYDRIMTYEAEDTQKLVPGVAESNSVSDDGKTITLKIRPGQKFHSGNPLTAEDVAFSIQRVIILNKTPAFIFSQLGWTPENVKDLVKAKDDLTVELTITEDFAPTFVLNCLSAGVGSVVDKKLVLEHQNGDDLGYEWLKTNSAGSGPYKLRAWKPNDSVVLEAADGYWGGDVALKRVFVRHVPEGASRRLLVEQGDADIARRLPPNDAQAIAANPELKLFEEQRGRIYYLGANQKHEALGKPEVVQALRYLIDYEGMTNSILKGQYVVHQSFLPIGFLGAIEDNPFKLDVAKAKELLTQAGYPDGFEVEISVRNEQPALDIAQAIQNTLGQAGIKASIKSGAGAEILDSYRARTHELIVQNWGPDYPDPQTNASTFAANPGNADEDKNTGYLAWRNAYAADETKAMVDAAVVEKDTEKRRAMYEEMQRIDQQKSPIICMFQETEQVGLGKTVEGFSTGGAVASAFYWTVTK